MAIKVFCMNDLKEWWAGESLEECAAAAKAETGEDYPQDGFGNELNAEAMSKMQYVTGNSSRTFEEELQLMIASGYKFPCLFAASDY